MLLPTSVARALPEASENLYVGSLTSPPAVTSITAAFVDSRRKLRAPACRRRKAALTFIAALTAEFGTLAWSPTAAFGTDPQCRGVATRKQVCLPVRGQGQASGSSGACGQSPSRKARSATVGSSVPWGENRTCVLSVCMWQLTREWQDDG